MDRVVVVKFHINIANDFRDTKKNKGISFSIHKLFLHV